MAPKILMTLALLGAAACAKDDGHEAHGGKTAKQTVAVVKEDEPGVADATKKEEDAKEGDKAGKGDDGRDGEADDEADDEAEDEEPGANVPPALKDCLNTDFAKKQHAKASLNTCTEFSPGMLAVASGVGTVGPALQGNFVHYYQSLALGVAFTPQQAEVTGTGRLECDAITATGVDLTVAIIDCDKGNAYYATETVPHAALQGSPAAALYVLWLSVTKKYADIPLEDIPMGKSTAEQILCKRAAPPVSETCPSPYFSNL